MSNPLTSVVILTTMEEQLERELRIWRDSTGLHRQEAALLSYKEGIVHLSSSDGSLVVIPEDQLSQDDLNYLESQNVHKTKPVGFFRRVLGRLGRHR